jgi:hypothetical protein
MSRFVGITTVALLAAAGCGYWQARPAANTAPASWAASPATGAPAVPGGPGGGSSLEERFENLERLRRNGVISQAEYRERRQEILDERFEPPR